MPQQYLERVATLQDHAPHEPFPKVKACIEKSLGKKLEEMFEWVEEVPLGAASIGQAHRARMLDGRDVVIKVMYPSAEKLFHIDVLTMKAFLYLAQPQQIPLLNEVERQFITEFDYIREGENLQTVRTYAPTH